ncbi:MAG: hypothetical protein QM613_05570 [Micrococcaceae bacterium]
MSDELNNNDKGKEPKFTTPPEAFNKTKNNLDIGLSKNDDEKNVAYKNTPSANEKDKTTQNNDANKSGDKTSSSKYRYVREDKIQKGHQPEDTEINKSKNVAKNNDTNINSNGPKPLELTPQIKRDYAYTNPNVGKQDKPDIKTKAIRKLRSPKPNGKKPNKRGIAIVAVAAIVGGGMLVNSERESYQTYDGGYDQHYSVSKDGKQESADAKVNFGDTVQWEKTGVEMTINDPKIAKSTDETEGTDSSQYLVFTVVLHNSSNHTISKKQLRDIEPTLSYGDSQTEADQVTDDSNNVTNKHFKELKPGDTQRLRYGFAVPNSGLDQISLDMGKPRSAEQNAVYVGSYTTDDSGDSGDDLGF